MSNPGMLAVLNGVSEELQKRDAEIARLAARVEELEQALSGRTVSCSQCNAMAARVEVLEKALRVYAMHSNWDFRRAEGHGGDIVIDGYVFDGRHIGEDDPWLIAQQALAAKGDGE